MDLRIKYVDPHAKNFLLFSILRFCDDPDPNDPNEKTKRKNQEKILKDTFGEEGKENLRNGVTLNKSATQLIAMATVLTLSMCQKNF